MQKNSREVVRNFMRRDNAERLAALVLGKYGARDWIKTNMTENMWGFVKVIEAELEEADLVGLMTVNDYTRHYNAKYMEWVDSILAEYRPVEIPYFVMNDGDPMASGDYSKSPNELLEAWRMNAGRNRARRDDPHGEKGLVNRAGDHCIYNGHDTSGLWSAGLAAKDAKLSTRYMSKGGVSAPTRGTAASMYSGGQGEVCGQAPRYTRPSVIQGLDDVECDSTTLEGFSIDPAEESRRGDNNWAPSGSAGYGASLSRRGGGGGPSGVVMSPYSTRTAGRIDHSKQEMGLRTTYGGGIVVCDQSGLNTSQHYDQLFGTAYNRALNVNRDPHTRTPFGASTPDADARLMSREGIFRKEGGVENGIPNYRKRLHRRYIDPDLKESLSSTEYDFQQRGHDRTELLARIDSKQRARYSVREPEFRAMDTLNDRRY